MDGDGKYLVTAKYILIAPELHTPRGINTELVQLPEGYRNFFVLLDI
jgi:hypothetical protein